MDSQVEWGYRVLPEVSGGFYLSGRASSAINNQPLWAKITGSTEVRLTPDITVNVYGWEQQTPERLGLVKADGGLAGTIDPEVRNPIVDPNNATLEIDSYIRVQPFYYDEDYDVVFMPVGGGGGGADRVAIVRAINSLGNGWFDAIRGAGKFNANTLAYELGVSVLLLDAAFIIVPNPVP